MARISKPYAVRLRADINAGWGEWLPLTTRQYEKITDEWVLSLAVITEIQLLLEDGVAVISPVSQFAQYCLIDQQQKELF